jgi:uncharacterized protein (TIGR02118 family)
VRNKNKNDLHSFFHRDAARTLRHGYWGLVYSLTSKEGAQLVKVSVLYPNGAGTKFDMTYYLNQHMPMVRRLLGSALKAVSVEHGISGEQPGSPAPYIATGHLLFDSVQSFQASFAPHAQEIMEDIPKYTNSEPLLQIGEVKL